MGVDTLQSLASTRVTEIYGHQSYITTIKQEGSSVDPITLALDRGMAIKDLKRRRSWFLRNQPQWWFKRRGSVVSANLQQISPPLIPRMAMLQTLRSSLNVISSEVKTEKKPFWKRILERLCVVAVPQPLLLTWILVLNLMIILTGLSTLINGYLVRCEDHYLDRLLEASVSGSYNVKFLRDTMAILVMFSGCFLAVFSFVGCVGICFKLNPLLKYYCCLMLMIVLLQILVLIIAKFAAGELDERTAKGLTHTLKTYEGYASVEALTESWNYVFTRFQCCGSHGYSDMTEAVHWSRCITYANSQVNLTTPIYCCRLHDDFPMTRLPETADCAVWPNSTNSNFERGCYPFIKDWMLRYNKSVMVCWIMSIVLQVLNVVAVCFRLNG